MKYIRKFESKLTYSYDKFQEREKNLKDQLDTLNNKLKKNREKTENSDDYYKLISSDDVNRLIGLKDFEDNRIDFSGNEIDLIKSALDDKYKVYVTNKHHFSYKTYQTINVSRPKLGKELFKYEIWKLEDEWYIVKMGDIHASIYYQCDQFEGLLKLLNKSKI